MFRDALCRQRSSRTELLDIAQIAARSPAVNASPAAASNHVARVITYMKIIVAIKQVPERDAPCASTSAGKWIEESDLQFAMNEPDAHALEEALQLKEKHGGEVVVLSAGPERVGTTIREALAKGADRAIHSIATILSSATPLAWRNCWPMRIKPESPTWCSPACSLKTSAWPDRCDSCRTAGPASRHAHPSR